MQSPLVTRTRPTLTRPRAAGPWDRLVIIIVGLHALIALVHGIAHQRVSVDLTLWQDIFVGAVIVIAPLAGIAIRARGRWRLGTVVVGVSMLAACVFGALYHFVLGGDDNIRLHGAWSANAPSVWASVFTVSAVAVVATEMAGTVAAGLALAVRNGRGDSGRGDSVLVQDIGMGCLTTSE